ncbi:MAG TPA: secretion protein [Polyangia bacterium]|jgi:type III secretion protein J|nr:secretion protein [Polyangia bacterium]
MRAADGKIFGAVLLALTVGSTVGCSTAILHGLEEPSANETVAALERVGIGAEKQPDDDSNNGGGALAFKVRVARADEARALEQLRSLGLPRERRHGFAEVYGQPSLIPTASEERARYLDALAGEVARTLEIADGVVRARVHLVPEEIDPLAGDGRARTPARAAVLIKARGGKIPLGEADIKKLVAGSVPGLDPAAVAVVVTAAADPAAAAGEQWSSLGPLRLAPGSRALLIAALVVGLGLLGAMAALLLLTLRRQAAPEPPAGR